MASVELEVTGVAAGQGLAPAVVLEGRDDPGIVHALLRDIDRGAELVPGQPGRGAPVRAPLRVAADRPACAPLLRAGPIALDDRDRDAGLPLRPQERPHRDRLEPNAVDVTQRRTLGARILR